MPEVLFILADGVINIVALAAFTTVIFSYLLLNCELKKSNIQKQRGDKRGDEWHECGEIKGWDE